MDDYCVLLNYFCGWYIFNTTGVDLNLQFPAGWEEAKKIKFSKGYNKPAPRDFVGPKPLSEPEAQAIYNFTKQHKFDLILAYHSAGETIYWKYKEYLPKNSEKIAKEFSIVSNYTYEETPYESSFAGYKDWYIQEYNKPGYTIEVGNGTSPLPLSDFNKIYEDNKKILTLGLKLA
ncbi:MAG: hypothetical protein HFJ53_03440 [Clostridia bacterium]|nr:hypothetical protein [Clostridia bacterium]